MKTRILHIAAALPLVIASCLPGLAKAAYYGQTVHADFSGFDTYNSFDFGTAVVGDGVEFTRTAGDAFGQIWTFSIDITNTNTIVSWVEGTRFNHEGNTWGEPDSFGFNLEFSAPLTPLSLSHTHFHGQDGVVSGLSGVSYQQPDAVHFGFSHLVSGESYLFSSAVPEPGSYAMLLAGLGLVGCAARRRKAR